MLEEKYESIFAGKLEEGEDTSLDSINKKKDEDDDDSEKEDSDSDDSKEDSDDSDDDSEKEESDDSEDSDDDSEKEESDDDSEESDDDSDDDSKGSFGKKSGGDSGIQNKIKQLQKQYNDLLVDAFERYAAECIENALDGVETSFGENITDILDQALQELKGKILADIGVEDNACCGMDGEMGGMEGGMEMDLGDEPEVTFGSEVGGIPTMIDNGEESDEGDESSEDEDDDEDEESDEKPKKESCKPKKSKKMIKESTLVANFYGFV